MTGTRTKASGNELIEELPRAMEASHGLARHPRMMLLEFKGHPQDWPKKKPTPWALSGSADRLAK